MVQHTLVVKYSEVQYRTVQYSKAVINSTVQRHTQSERRFMSDTEVILVRLCDRHEPSRGTPNQNDGSCLTQRLY